MFWCFYAVKAKRHDYSSNLGAEMIDPLTEMLRGLRLDGVEYGRCQPSAPWATAYPRQAEAQFHFLAAGHAFLQSPSGEWTEMHAGDAVLLPRGDAHVLASAPGLPSTPVECMGPKASLRWYRRSAMRLP